MKTNLNWLIIFNFLFVFIFCSSCTSLFYQPDQYLYSDPQKLKIPYEEVMIPSSDGTKLSLWSFQGNKNQNKKTLILFFHGNAQNISSHYYNLLWILPHGFDYMILDYRGYGISEGEPKPESVRQDALAFLNYGYEIYKKREYKKLIVYGQSLGGAVLLDALQFFKFQEEIGLAVFDSTFLSYQNLAKDKLKNAIVTYPFFWLAYLLISDKTAPYSYAPYFKQPSLVIHGDSDKIIPEKFGEEFYQKLGANKKWFWKVKDGEHIDVFTAHKDEYQNKFLELLLAL